VAAIGEAEARLAQARSQESRPASSSPRPKTSGASTSRAHAIFRRARKVFRNRAHRWNCDQPSVRTGETVVPGIQNAAASTIMTIADMSLITAELKVDETDIINVKLDQAAEVTVDAMPNRVIQGRVIEIGNTAILRSTGLAASQSTTANQEAKDFKVVIALDHPPEEIRPGLSATGKITTATRQHTLTVPIQALTVRQRGDLEAPDKNKGVQAASKIDPGAGNAKKEELQGVFVVSNARRSLAGGNRITGATDIEILSGLSEGDQIVTGSYKVIRTLRNFTKVRVDNRATARS